MRRRRSRSGYPLSTSDMMEYRRKAQNMSLFQKDCALMGINPRTFNFQQAAIVEPMGFHRPMDFIGGNEQPPPPRREFSGTNVDE